MIFPFGTSNTGTIFLWLFWPSFNGALDLGEMRYRAIINTYIGLAAAAVVAFAVSSLVNEKGKFDMVRKFKFFSITHIKSTLIKI